MSEDTNTVELTANIVSAYVANNSVQPLALADLISGVNQALLGLMQPKAEPMPELTPAVAVKKSVTPDYIVSLEDGRKFKSMKRHLALKGMTPAEDPAKWGLAKDYPMVAPNYAAQRSELAKSLGLGRKPAVGVPVASAPEAKKGRGRPKKAAA